MKDMIRREFFLISTALDDKKLEGGEWDVLFYFINKRIDKNRGLFYVEKSCIDLILDRDELIESLSNLVEHGYLRKFYVADSKYLDIFFNTD